MNSLLLIEIYILFRIFSKNKIPKSIITAVFTGFLLLGLYLSQTVFFIDSTRFNLFIDSCIMLLIVASLTFAFTYANLSFQTSMLQAGICLLIPLYIYDFTSGFVDPFLLNINATKTVDLYASLFIDISLFVGIALALSILLKYLHGSTYLSTHKYTQISLSILILLLLAMRIPSSYLQFASQRTSKEIALSTAIFCVVIFLIFFLLNKYDNEIKAAKYIERQKEIFSANESYVAQVENRYKEIRKIQHDYENNLLVIHELIKNNEKDASLAYITELINVTDYGNLKANPHFLQLEHVENKALKNLLLIKLTNLPNTIHLNIEIPEKVKMSVLSTNSIVRCIGIILDNAIEELEHLPTGTLTFGILLRESDIIFEITNTCSDDVPTIHHLMTMNYSTKGPDRGFGLSNLEEIVDNSNDLFLETQITNNKFTQTLVLTHNEGAQHAENINM